MVRLFLFSSYGGALIFSDRSRRQPSFSSSWEKLLVLVTPFNAGDAPPP